MTSSPPPCSVAPLSSPAWLAGLELVLPAPADDRLVTDRSAVPLLAAAGLTLALNGVAFGLWLLLIGAELLAFAFGVAFASDASARTTR